MTMDRASQSSSDSPTQDVKVVSIECLRGSAKSEEWSGDMLQSGDIVEELRIGSSSNSQNRFKSPFKNGKSGVNKILQDSRIRRRTHLQWLELDVGFMSFLNCRLLLFLMRRSSMF